MFSGVRNYIAGWSEVSFEKKSRSDVFDLMYKSGIRFFRERTDGDRVYVRLKEVYARYLCCELDRVGIEYTHSRRHGVAVLLRALAFRAAIPIGVILFFVWMMYSSKLIWDVRVFGNTKTPTEEIVALLEELGCGIGDYYPSIDFSRVHSRYAACQNDIAWLSVYMDGTVAEVQVRELYADTRDKHEPGVYANVVASCDGVVESVNVFEGQAVVKAGDIVRAGQVLISGVVELKDGGVRYEYAAGEVICTVAEPISVKIALDREKKVYTEQIFSKKSVKIFKKTINLCGKGGIEGATYDKIDTMEQLCPFGLCTVPIWVMKSEYREYVTETEVISADEAAEYALLELSAAIREKTNDATLISRDVRVNIMDGVYTLDCLLYVSRDIASTLEFKLNSSGEAILAEK